MDQRSVRVQERTGIRIEEQVKRYETWLSAESRRTTSPNALQNVKEYVAQAASVTVVDGKPIQAFAPFRREHSALKTFSPLQITVLCAIVLAVLLGFVWLGISMLAIVVALFTLIYVGNLILDAFVFYKASRQTAEEHIDEEVVHALKNADWPMYTILCPLYHETDVVPQFIRAMKALDYPVDKLQILLLTEEDDAATRNLLRSMALPPHFQIKTVPQGRPRTKPRACNFGLMRATGAYIVIYDAEDIPDPLQLKKAVLAFANHSPELACIQAKLNYYNMHQNLLTRWFTAEYSTWFDLTLPGLHQINFSLPLGGTSNHFRAEVLRALGGWDVFNVTEDCDLGLRLARYHLRTVILDSTTYEEANSRVKNWLRQRSRWIKGYMQTYLVHTRQSFQYLRDGRWREFLSLQIIVGNRTSLLFLNPFMWTLLAIYIAFQPFVINTYHILFPWPVLYSGALCLIFGNFFYVYLYLLACMKRKQYALVKWALFIPLYWVLISVAAFYALFELLVRPYHWHKTIHGLHLRGQPAQPVAPATSVVEREAGVGSDTHPAISAVVQAQSASSPDAVTVGDVPSITTSLRAISTQPVPAISQGQRQAQLISSRYKVRDLWLVATIVIACITSVVACWYYFQHHELAMVDDALSHMRIARSVFDSTTPGLAQLGAIWLPLPHIIMWPFIWNNYLWRTGLAGSFASMPCYVITAVYIFLSVRRLTKKSSAAFIGALAFILNPMVLYLQSTPLGEVVCMATMAASIYYFLLWVQEEQLKFLIMTAASTFLATLARYDGWALFAALVVLIPIIEGLKRKQVSRLIADGIMFLTLGGLGIILWLLWNKIVFGDLFYFKDSIYSAQSQQAQILQAGHLFAYHNLWQSLFTYITATEQSCGMILCFLAIAGLAWFVWRQRRTIESLAILIFLVPFAFYIVSLYTGQAVIWVGGAIPAGTPIYNVRYGAQMVVPMAVLLVLPLHTQSPLSLKRVQALLQCLLFLVLIVQYGVLSYQGIPILKETADTTLCHPLPEGSRYLAQHYDGGYILENVYTTEADPTTLNIDFRDIIWEGSNALWRKALHDPADTVDWIFINPTNSNDSVAQVIDVHRSSFLANFVLVAKQPDGLELFHRRGRPIQNHPVPTEWNLPQTTCPPR